MKQNSKSTTVSENSSVEGSELKDSLNTEESSQTMKGPSRLIDMTGKGPRVSVEIIGGVKRLKKN